MWPSTASWVSFSSQRQKLILLFRRLFCGFRHLSYTMEDTIKRAQLSTFNAGMYTMVLMFCDRQYTMDRTTYIPRKSFVFLPYPCATMQLDPKTARGKRRRPMHISCYGIQTSTTRCAAAAQRIRSVSRVTGRDNSILVSRSYRNHPVPT